MARFVRVEKVRSSLLVWLPVAIACALLGCAEPTLISCPAGELPCVDGCADLASDDRNCGACGRACAAGARCVAGDCVPAQPPATCAVNNGGCGLGALCAEVGGGVVCTCGPGLTGNGQVCQPCASCDPTQFEAAACTPFADTVCAACTACGPTEFEIAACTAFGDAACLPCTTCGPTEYVAAACTAMSDTTCAPCTVGCGFGFFEAAACTATSDTVCAACTTGCTPGFYEVQPCGPVADLLCAACTLCQASQYEALPCDGTQDTMCVDCAFGCATCDGPGDTCTSCEPGWFLVGGACLQPMCGNGLVEPGEACDDGNPVDGDGCSAQCQVEPDYYCFGDLPTTCRPGACVTEPATALPLGPAFAIDGVATTSAAGITFTQRSTIYTTADVQYPVLIEADVVYSGDDLTLVGTRGTGLRDPLAADEPTDSLRARLSQCCGYAVELATGPGTTVIAATVAPFVPTLGVPYRVRFFDDGLFATVEWFDLTNPGEGVAIGMPSSFHGGGDRAFIGGGDLAGLTVSNLRVCAAPALPVTSGLAAHYSAVPSWTVVRDGLDQVSQWQDASGNANHLAVNGSSPVFSPGLIAGQAPGLDFTGAARLTTAPFPLTTDVTVFAVLQHRTPATWGAIAHHGSRDLDWSMEQSGFSGNSNVLHWQTNNDNANVELTLVPDEAYVLTGRFDGNARYFAAAALTGTSPAPAAIVDASHTIAAGTKPLYVGSSDANEASNAFIGELVYFSRALDDAERDAVIAYLHARWRPLYP